MKVQVVDIFCGGGGFSTGASQAGAIVSVAVDSWDVALKVHALNHPKCTHILAECDSDRNTTPKAMAKRIRAALLPDLPVHLHCSPPCQQLTHANKINPDGKEGMRLVNWSIALKEELKPASFTLEQVNHPDLREFLTKKKIPFDVVRMQHHGVPQCRRRIIACEPPIFPIEQLPPKMMSEALGLPRGMEHRSSNARLVKTCDGPGYTVTSLVYRVRFPGKEWRTLTFPEVLKLQTFPGDYNLGGQDISNQDRRRIIGNSVPPFMAKQIMEKLMASKGKDGRQQDGDQQ